MFCSVQAVSSGAERLEILGVVKTQALVSSLFQTSQNK
jgi:hypothetical protein